MLSKGSKKTIVWIVGVLLTAVLIMGIYSLGKKHGSAPNDPELTKQITQIDTNIQETKEITKGLETKLKKLAVTKKAIKPPKTELEVIERSKALGYPPL